MRGRYKSTWQIAKHWVEMSGGMVVMPHPPKTPGKQLQLKDSVAQATEKVLGELGS